MRCEGLLYLQLTGAASEPPQFESLTGLAEEPAPFLKTGSVELRR